MKTMRSRVLATALGAVTLTMLFACEVTGVGVDSSVGVGYVGGYYEPYGYDYGGWGGAYRVGPSRCCEHRDDHGRDGREGRDGGHDARGGHGGRAPAYRPAPAGRSAPSIPGRSRGR
jgi:hypothetical protein